MLSSIKSELRKLLTIRSTYIIFACMLVLIAFFAFYAQGIAAVPEDAARSTYLDSIIRNAANLVFTISTFITILMVTHEYRYNTIMYTLTSSKSRAQSLFAKLVVATGLALVLTTFFCILAPLLSILGASIGGHEIGPQTLYFKDLIWQCLFSGWGIMTLGFVLAVIIRSQIGAIIMFLMLPTTVESLLSLLLKDNAKYLPFNAISSVSSGFGSLTPGKAAIVSLIYLAVGLAVSFGLFIKRDAN